MITRKTTNYIYSEGDIMDFIKNDLEEKNVDTDNVNISLERTEWGEIKVIAEVLEDGD